MNPVSRTIDPESQRLIDEYLERGGTVTKCESKKRTENIEFISGFYAKRKKKKPESDE